jgi:hypothetical protein
MDEQRLTYRRQGRKIGPGVLPANDFAAAFDPGVSLKAAGFIPAHPEPQDRIKSGASQQ